LKHAALLFGSAGQVSLLAGCANLFRKNSADAVTPDPQTQFQDSLSISRPKELKPGFLSIVQGPTSDRQSNINVVVPRLKRYQFQIIDTLGKSKLIEPYKTVSTPTLFRVEKFLVSGLMPGQTYRFQVLDPDSQNMVVDSRQFSSLDVERKNPRFALLSCMHDAHRFAPVIPGMWARLREQAPDFLIFCGDAIYIDANAYVPLHKATEYDIWQRYIMAMQKLPIYSAERLTPIFAVWDDHDFGTNDGDRSFNGKQKALEVFDAIFLGQELEAIWHRSKHGLAQKISLAHQDIFFLDNRSFRQPNRARPIEAFGYLGRAQHEWLLSELKKSTKPAILVNGNQFFSPVEFHFKEAFEQNQKLEFDRLISELRKLPRAIVFASGDVHFSEIMSIGEKALGYQTYEITSSPMHSFVYGGWENPLRLKGAFTREFNFVTIQSEPFDRGVHLHVQSFGLKEQPYFDFKLQVQRT